MKIIVKFYFLFLLTFFIQKSYAGSYLFCANKNGEWKWANQNLSNKYSWAPPDKNGFWLVGSLYIVNEEVMLHSTLSLDLSKEKQYEISIPDPNGKPYAQTMIKIKSSAVSACQKLVETCQESFGKEYNQVGAASYSLAASDWGYVVADKLICPNWHYQKGAIITNGSGVGAFIGNLFFDMVTNGPGPNEGSLRPKPSIIRHNPNIHFKTPLPRKVYRVDTRAPDEIFKDGFKSRGNNYDLAKHLQGKDAIDSAYISTTDSLQIAEQLAAEMANTANMIENVHQSSRPKKNGRYIFVYNIEPKESNYLYIPDQLPNTARWKELKKQQEWAAIEKIFQQEIMSVDIYQRTFINGIPEGPLKKLSTTVNSTYIKNMPGYSNGSFQSINPGHL